jgi:hypothetical protein
MGGMNIMQVPVRARLLRPAGTHERGGGRVRAGVRGGGAAVRAQGHRHLVQDAEVPRLGEVVPEVRTHARTLSCRLPRRRHRGDGSSRTQMKVCHFLAVRGGGVRAQGRQPQPGGAARRPAALQRHRPG